MRRETGDPALLQRAPLGMLNEQAQGQICAPEITQKRFLEQ